MKNLLLILSFLLSAFSGFCQVDTTLQIAQKITIDTNLKVIVNQLTLLQSAQEIKLKVANSTSGKTNVYLNGVPNHVLCENGICDLDKADLKIPGLNFFKEGRNQNLYHISSYEKGYRIRHLPLWLSLIPPIIAIGLALLFKEVITSLFIGILSGALIITGLDWESIAYYIKALLRTIDTYILKALTDSSHISIILFSLLIGGMVALISKNGGMLGIVLKLSKYAKSRVSAQLITWLLGLLIFFDDYANTLIVGNTMRSVTDKFKVSREKLAYIVDSTAAPVAAVAFITTWIGAELGYIGDSIIGIPILEAWTPYSIFIASLKYAFYPILTLVFIVIIITQKKDFGPMYTAEMRAIKTGQVSPAKTEKDDEPNMEDLTPVSTAKNIWWHAALPIGVVIFTTIVGLLSTGFESLGGDASWSETWVSMKNEGGSFFTNLGNVIGAADSYAALIWSSFLGVVTALVITLGSKTMKLLDSIHWLITGFKTMFPAILILVLAWALASTTHELHTAEYLSMALGDNVNPYIFPLVIFILAAFISFSTGSSWSTMAILYPIAIPTAFAVCQASNISPALTLEIIFAVVSTVLSASVLGDHCSPISDTTILSSLATDCNHIDHVKTQLPYALVVGTTSMFCLLISLILGGGWILNFVIALVAIVGLFFAVKLIGKPINGHFNSL